MKEACVTSIDRKRFAQAAEITRKMNDRNGCLQLEVIHQCGEQLRVICPTSFEKFRTMSSQRRRVARSAVKSALRLETLPSEEVAYDALNNLRSECKSLDQAGTSVRNTLGRLFQYVSSTVID